MVEDQQFSKVKYNNILINIVCVCSSIYRGKGINYPVFVFSDYGHPNLIEYLRK